MQYFYCIIFLGGDTMRKRVTYTLDVELIDRLKKVSEETMIPQSKLVEKGIRDAIAVHEKQAEYQTKKEQSE